MSSMVNGRGRTKTAREAYIEYNSNKKRKPFTHLNSYDDSSIAYQSTPEYLRQLMNTSTLSNTNSARSLTRTYSATEMTPRNLGNPKYKAQEDYYDEVQSLKKELKGFKEDNSHLRAKIRRLEEDNARKRKELDNFCTTTTTNNNDSRRSSISSPATPFATNNIVMNLKQRLFKLELQLKQKETTIDEMKNDLRWTKGTELEIQNRALLNEIEKQKFERLNFIQNDYTATIEEEKKKAIRKLESENRDLKIENKNLKKKVQESEKSDAQTSARERDASPDDDYHRHKREDIKELRNKHENELDQIKSELKQMRRERDKYRDKFENLNEDCEEIKRDRDQYRQKFQQLKHELEQQQPTKSTQIHRSSPTLKRDDEHYHKRSSSNLSRRDSHSPEEFSKKDSRPSTPIKKSTEHLTPRSSKKSLQSLRRDDSIKDDDYHRKKRRREEEQAATIIQRNWRKHNRLQKKSSNNKTKQDSFDQRHSRTSGIASPRASQQKLGSKLENLGSDSFKTRPTSADVSHDTALKTVQAALRGHMNRTNLDKPQKFERNGNDDNGIGTPFKQQFGSEKRRDIFQNPSNSRLQTSNRDLSSKSRRTPSPPLDQYRPSSPQITNNYGSKQNLYKDRTQLTSGSRVTINDREPLPRTHRTPSPPADIQRSSSPRNLGSKQSLSNDKNKMGSNNRFERESSSKLQRPYSPSNPRQTSPENIRPSSRQSNTSVRKSPLNSKQSLNKSHDDDDDVF